MFIGGYYAEKLKLDLQGKKYNSTWLLIKHYLQLIAFALIVLLGVIFM